MSYNPRDLSHHCRSEKPLLGFKCLEDFASPLQRWSSTRFYACLIYRWTAPQGRSEATSWPVMDFPFPPWGLSTAARIAPLLSCCVSSVCTVNNNNIILHYSPSRFSCLSTFLTTFHQPSEMFQSSSPYCSLSISILPKHQMTSSHQFPKSPVICLPQTQRHYSPPFILHIGHYIPTQSQSQNK